MSNENGETGNGPVLEDEEEAVYEAKLSRVRNGVNENKIKLWVEPYYTGDATADQVKLMELGSNLALTLDMDEDTVTGCLKTLQSNALEKLEARDALAKSNLLSLKIKLSKGLAIKEAPTNKNLSVNIDMYSTGDELASQIASKLTVNGESECSVDSLRLISNGKTISTGGGEEDVRGGKGSKTLSQLGIKPGSVVMALLIDAADHSLAIVNEQRRILNTAKADAQLFTGDDGRLELTDQSGKEVELPKAEKDALVMAMSLHEKGRAAMRKGNFELGLVLLLEASEEYESCRAQILNTVDNYAILNLDIAWCYLRIGKVSELPDAAGRLAECESKFNSSYGANLERVKAVKGHTGEESVLLVRMHLLQAVVAFHSGQVARAKLLLKSTAQELDSLRVPEGLLKEVIANGFTEREARLAIRSVYPSTNVTAAVKHAQKTREDRERIEGEELRRKNRRNKFGKTLKGNWVNLGLLETMTRMGYDERLAAEALRQTENDVNAATECLNEKPELLLTAIQDKDFNAKDLSQETVGQVAAMGFGEEDANKALVLTKGNMEAAIELLTSGVDLDAQKEPLSKRIKKALDPEEEKRREEAYDRLQDDLDEADPEAYLDLTLDDEKSYLDKYRNYMDL